MSQRAEFVFAIAMAHHIEMFQPQRPARTLRCSMVLTVEPGIYIPKGSEGVDPKWQGIGIRIEDDILVTKEGPRNQSARLPRKAEDVERALK